MLEGLRHLVLGRPWTEILHDLVDILIVAFIVYRAMLVLRGTRAMQMGIGFIIFGLLYLLAKYAEFITLLNVLSWLASSLILIAVVVFQSDIRRALIRMGAKAWLRSGREQQTKAIDEVVEAATELARHRIGAIIAFERDANLLEFVRSEGILLESAISRELLVSLFLPESLNKTHDGAVLIRNLKISRAGMFFPMPEGRVADPNFGSRHRAAIGITEETDAVVVVVSEERGTITLCFAGSYVANIDGSNLRKTLLEQLGHKPANERKPLFRRIGDGLRRRSSVDEAPVSSKPAAKPPAKKESASTRKAEPAAAEDDEQATPSGEDDRPSERTPSDEAERSDASPASGGSGGKAEALRRSTKVSTKVSGQVSGQVSGSADIVPKSTDVEVVEATSKTPPPSRVSKPMPQAKDRKASSDDEEDAVESPGSRTSVTKSMRPTELPASSTPSGGDER